MPALEAVTTDCPVNTADADGKFCAATMTVGPLALLVTPVVVSANRRLAAAFTGTAVYFTTRPNTAAQAAASKPRRSTDRLRGADAGVISDVGLVIAPPPNAGRRSGQVREPDSSRRPHDSPYPLVRLFESRTDLCVRGRARSAKRMPRRVMATILRFPALATRCHTRVTNRVRLRGRDCPRASAFPHCA